MKFKWLVNNSVIECKEVEDRQAVMVLKDGIIKHADNSISTFSSLILSKNELQKIEEQKIGGRGRRKGGATL
jgi:ribosomal protein L19E